MSTSGSKRTRNDSPAPKGSAKAGSKATSLSTASVSVAAKAAAQPPKKDEKLICGFHPEVFKAVVGAPLALAAFIGAVFFLDVGKTTVKFVDAQWAIYSAPIGKFLASNADAIVLLTAAGALAPFVIVMLVNTWHAAMDLGHFPLWVQGLLLLLTGGASVSFFITNPDTCLAAFAWVQKQWNTVSDPIEDILKNKSDAVIQGVAFCCMAPIAAAMIAYLLRAVWGCRVQLVKEEEKKPA